MITAVILMVAATIWAASRHFQAPPPAPPIRLGTDPDQPHPFGTDMAWLAIRTKDTNHVLEALQLTGTSDANWQSGIGAVYHPKLGDSHIFVTPPVNGWTYVLGLSLPAPLGRAFIDKATPLLLDLSERFVEVQYYFACPDDDYFAWARVIDGRLVRAFAINDEGVIWNRGKPTPEERSMGLKLFELRGVKGRKGDAGGDMLLYPTEGHMMELAGKWSLNPMALKPEIAPPAIGRVGIAPRTWRPERLASKAA